MEKNNEYTEVTDEGQTIVNTGWIISDKAKEEKIILKAQLVAREFGEKVEGNLEGPIYSFHTIKIFLNTYIANNLKSKIIYINLFIRVRNKTGSIYQTIRGVLIQKRPGN